MYLRAPNKAGLTVPWVWTRRQIAARWGIPPLMVDSYPIDEVELEIRLSNMEAEHAPKDRNG